MSQPSLNSQIQRILKHYFEDLEAVLLEAGHGAAYRSVLAGLDLNPEGPGDLSYDNYLAALQLLARQALIPGLGLRLGDRKRHGTFGLSGLNMLTQPTLGQANRFAAESFHLCWGPFLSLHLAMEGAWAIARYEASPAPLAMDTAVLEQALVTGIRMIGELLPDLDWSACRGHFAFPAPAHAALYARYLPFPCSFGQPFNGWRFPATWIERAPLMADEDVKRFCELRFRTMLEEGAAPDALGPRIRRILAEADPANPPGAEAIARRLALPVRVVRDRLAEEGTSLRTLLNEVLMDKARELLADPRLSVKEIAFRLGYAQPPSFHRAFAKSVGQTPKQFQARANC